LYQKRDRLRAAATCIACMEKHKCVIFPCGHFIFCSDCYIKWRSSSKSTVCPMCRHPFNVSDLLGLISFYVTEVVTMF
jgi:hypothetical protein